MVVGVSPELQFSEADAGWQRKRSSLVETTSGYGIVETWSTCTTGNWRQRRDGELWRRRTDDRDAPDGVATCRGRTDYHVEVADGAVTDAAANPLDQRRGRYNFTTKAVDNTATTPTGLTLDDPPDDASRRGTVGVSPELQLQRGGAGRRSGDDQDLVETATRGGGDTSTTPALATTAGGELWRRGPTTVTLDPGSDLSGSHRLPRGGRQRGGHRRGDINAFDGDRTTRRPTLRPRRSTTADLRRADDAARPTTRLQTSGGDA